MSEDLMMIALFQPARRLLSTLILLCVFHFSLAQQAHSIGIFTGINLPGTIDAGINNDPRYRTKHAIKAGPFGLHYGIDFHEVGLAFDPLYFRTALNYFVINTVGGQIGERNVNLDFVRFPVTFKVHMIDLSFFRLSFVTSAGVGVLLSGNETIMHRAGLMYFPPEVYPNLPPEYVVDTDAVEVPTVKNTELLTKSDFKSMMIFGATGFRSDWNKSNNIQISLDMRVNYGFSDPRAQDYIDKIKANQAIYDIYGRRRELFITLTFGVSKTIEFSTPQTELRYRKKKTRDWRAPTLKSPKRGREGK
jgi:hypothetical protein